MRTYFLRFMIFMMRFDVMLAKQRVQENKDLIAHDERRIQQYEIELMQLGVTK